MSSISDQQERTSVGSSLGVVMLVFASVILLFWSSVSWLLQEWLADGVAGHGLIAASLACLLLFRSAASTSSGSSNLCWPAVLVTLALSMLWLVLRAANIASGQAFLLPLLLLFALCAVLGTGVAKRLLFPVLFLYFALPVWEPLKPLLRDLTILIVEQFLRYGGIPAMIDGALVNIPAGTFRIAKGCSGLNFFVVGLAIATLYGYLLYGSWKKRIVLALLGLGLALLGNWIRVAVLIAIGHQTSMQSVLIYDHQTFGWIIFAVLQLVFFAFAIHYGRGESGAADDSVRWSIRSINLTNSSLWPLMISVLCLAVGPLWAAAVIPTHSDSLNADLTLPDANGVWRGPLGNRGGWSPVYHGVTDERLGQYLSSDGSVWFYINIYLAQEQELELVYLHNRPEGEFERISSELNKITINGSDFFEVRDLIVDQGFRQRRIMYWYEIDGHRVSRDLQAKMLQARAVLLGNPAAGVVAVSSICEIDCQLAGERIQRFVRSLNSNFQLKSYLDRGES